MPVGAKYFQAVMDVMHNWSIDIMLSKMVNGKYAIEDTDNQLIPYVTAYCSKPQLEYVAFERLNAYPRLGLADEERMNRFM